MKNKITLKEFFESKKCLAIHCNTEAKASKLLKEFNKLGKKWKNGDSYLDYNNYENYGKDTIYYNDYQYGHKQFAEISNEEIYSFEDVIFEEEAKPKNLIPQIAKMLGVEIGEEFKISNKPDVYIFREDVLIGTDGDNIYNTSSTFFDLISGKEKIIKLPKKPILIEDEKVILRNIPEKYKYIARDKSGALYIYENKPKKYGGNVWFSYNYNYFDLLQYLFQFIKWEDQEPYNIEELLKGE